VKLAGPLKLLAGREDDPAVHQRHCAAPGVGHSRDNQRVGIDIPVVCQQRGRIDRQRLIFTRGDGVIRRHWRIVHRRDVHRDSGRRRPALAVGDRVVEAAGASKSASGVKITRPPESSTDAAAAVGDAHHAQPVPIDVAVVLQQRRPGDHQRGVSSVATVSPCATGASFTAATFTVTVAVAAPPWPSFTV
jgi:hypothetical protein